MYRRPATFGGARLPARLAFRPVPPVPLVPPGSTVPPLQAIVVDGVGLHSGSSARVILRAQGDSTGPVRLRSGGVEARIDELVVAGSARATTVEGPGGAPRVGTVEHAFAALAGLWVHGGLTLEVDGPELPLLDGGSSAWCVALQELGVAHPPRAPRPLPRLRVARAASFDVGPSRFEFAPADGVEVRVRLELDDPRLAPDAAWSGDAADFIDRIAPARTFALAHEVDELIRRGLARHVDPASVVVIAADAILHAGRPFSADEPARHKLLDLLGDLYLYGGPPLGRISAFRPGHAVNARAAQRALAEGILTPTGGGAAHSG
jgi:UDP-3-O-[3-hydroxymyristoyl] N-acetylglucosamine deacetylase